MTTEQATSRAGRVARLAAPLAVLGAVVALRPEIARGTFSSPTSLARVLAVVAAWLAFSWLVRRVVRLPAARLAVLGAAGAGLLSLTVLPYFLDKTVDDPLPVAAAQAPAPGPTTVAPADLASTRTPTVPAGPEKLAAGSLHGLAGHRGAGTAAVYRQPDGSILVRLEDFEVSNVPAPVLYVVPGAGRESPGDGIKLGSLRGSQGNQNFPVPPGTQLGADQTVLIWCEAFAVPVAAATASLA